MAMDLDDFLARLDGVHHHPRGIAARCPVPDHDDHVQSLSVGAGEHGGIVVKCQKDCATEAVVAAMGLTMADLMGLPYKVCDHHYTDVYSRWLYTVERWANPKTFRGYLPPLAERVLYNLPCVPWAQENNRPVLWVEGEKDVDNCSARGIPAVTGCGGAGPNKILPQYLDSLIGLDVIVVADNDPVGKEHAREKARLLDGKARSVQLMHSRVGNDSSDAFDANYGLEILEPLQTVEGVGAYVAAHVQPRKLGWAWKDHFALGKIGMIEGDPGDGKSIMTIDLAARWSTGMKMPDGSNGMPACPVLMVSAEDDLEDTLIPRIIAAGGDRSRIHLMVHGATPADPFTFKDGLPSVGQAILKHGIKVVFFDPLMAFLSGETDSHNDASVRRALQPLKLLASNTGVAIILVRHLNKGGTGNKAIYRGGGSIAFTGAARSTFLVTEGDDDTTRVMSCVKSNLSKKPPAITYTVEVSRDEVPYLRWGETVNLTAQQALDGPGRRKDTDASDERKSRKKVRTLAGEFLLDILSDGPMAWQAILELAKGEGFSRNTLERARAEVGLTKLTGGEGQRTTTWARPEVPPPAPLPHFSTQVSPKPRAPIGGEMGEREPDMAPKGESDSELTEEERRDDALMELPLACDVCGATDNVLRWFEPYWVIRCQPHNPRKYGGGK
jgi:hypothetical protein